MVAIQNIQGVAPTRLDSKPVYAHAERAVAALRLEGESGNNLPSALAVAGHATEERAELERLMVDINFRVQHVQRRLQFTIDEASGKTIVKVIDRDTDKVIRQIPTEEMLALARRLESNASALIDAQV